MARRRGKVKENANKREGKEQQKTHQGAGVEPGDRGSPGETIHCNFLTPRRLANYIESDNLLRMIAML
jgi:hypothetical protein